MLCMEPLIYSVIIDSSSLAYNMRKYHQRILKSVLVPILENDTYLIENTFYQKLLIFEGQLRKASVISRKYHRDRSRTMLYRHFIEMMVQDFILSNEELSKHNRSSILHFFMIVKKYDDIGNLSDQNKAIKLPYILMELDTHNLRNNISVAFLVFLCLLFCMKNKKYEKIEKLIDIGRQYFEKVYSYTDLIQSGLSKFDLS